MRLRRALTAFAAAALIGGTTVLAAPTASAGNPIVWHQAIAVPSASTPCPVTTDAEKTAGWSEWTASWDHWPNGGKGGNVCTRSITWAYEADPEAGTAYPSAFCVAINLTNGYVNFGGGWKLAQLQPAWLNSECSGPTGFVTTHFDVYAPDGPDQARALCVEAWGGYEQFANWGTDVYGCRQLV